tara:strand:+ start:9843 stop:10082 length:240 start_codon:yes stop_codon:yes gene_type:complete
MKNLQKYNEAFLKIFNLEDQILENLKYQSIETWDSVGHMALISELEEFFDIEMDIDDIIEFSDYQKGKEILKKYNVNLE